MLEAATEDTCPLRYRARRVQSVDYDTAGEQGNVPA